MSRRNLILALTMPLAAAAGGFAVWRSLGERVYSIPGMPPVTTRPAVEITRISPEKPYSIGTIEQFDTVGKEKAIIRIKNVLYDFGNGDRLTPEKEGVQSFAVVGGAVIVIAGGRLGYLTDKGIAEASKGSPLPFPPVRLQSDDGHDRLFLFGGAPRYPLARIANGKLALLAGAPEPITAAASRGGKTLFAVGRLIFELTAPGKPEALLEAPEKIMGLAVFRNELFFSLADSIYKAKGKSPVKIAAGLGGRIQAAGNGLIVLDSRTGGVFLLKGV